MKKILLALGPMRPEQMDRLETRFEVLRLWKAADPEGAVRDARDDIVAILSTYNSRGVSRRMIEALPNLEIIAQYGAGTDNIDTEAARERHISVTNTPDVLTEDTADIALSLVLALARRIVEADMFVRVGKWSSGPFPYGTSLRGRMAGIVGLGRIGNAIARRLEAFGVEVAYHGPARKTHAPYPYYESLEEMAGDADFLILSCAGGEGTREIVNLPVLRALGPEGYLVNVARGSVVAEEDLLIALNNRDIGGAGLDVYWREPNVPHDLVSLDNVVLLPHIGSATTQTRSRMGEMVVENLFAHFDGEALASPVTV